VAFGGGEGSETVTDEETTLADLRGRVAAFIAERDWEQFHTPENLSRAIAVEAAELMEHFLWLDGEETASLMDSSERAEAVVDELADVLIYVLSMANTLEIDVSRAILGKLARNERRFPVETWRGRARTDDAR
jgi:NTP pyrophosphatase (non-canonical NTP hydrolase)